MSGIEIDVSELLAAADDMQQATSDLVGKVQPAVAKGAVKIKAAMRADMAGSQHFGQAASAITYDTRAGGTWAEAQIGPTHAGAGPLANLAYFGGAHGGGGTVRDPQEAANDEAPAFEQALEQIIDGLL